jgi:hypothetical protein
MALITFRTDAEVIVSHNLNAITIVSREDATGKMRSGE